jgi:hypothetical protein
MHLITTSASNASSILLDHFTAQEALVYLDAHKDTKQIFDKVAQLIEGF